MYSAWRLLMQELEGGEYGDFPSLGLIPLPRFSKVCIERLLQNALISPPEEPAVVLMMHACIPA